MAEASNDTDAVLSEFRTIFGPMAEKDGLRAAAKIAGINAVQMWRILTKSEKATKKPQAKTIDSLRKGIEAVKSPQTESAAPKAV